MKCFIILLDMGLGRFALFMGLPLFFGFICAMAVVIEKTVDIIRDEIYDSKHSKANQNETKEEKKDDEQS